MGTMINRRRACGGKKGLLPSGYTEIQAVRSQGGFFTLGESATSLNYLYGCVANANGNNNWFFGHAGNQGQINSVGVNTGTIRFSSNWTRDVNFLNGTHTIEISKYGYSVDGVFTAWGNVATELPATGVFYILHASASAITPSDTIYRFWIKDVDTGEYIYNYVPCIRQSDNNIGLYEVVEGVFILPYGNVEAVN